MFFLLFIYKFLLLFFTSLIKNSEAHTGSLVYKKIQVDQEVKNPLHRHALEKIMFPSPWLVIPKTSYLLGEDKLIPKLRF